MAERSRVQRRLLRSAGPARTHLTITVVLGVVAAVLIVAQAALLAQAIARVAFEGADLAAIRGTLLWLAAIVVARGLVAGGLEVSGRVGAAKAMSVLRARLAEHVLVARPAGLARERSGELATVAVAGVDALEPWFARHLPQAVLAVVAPIAVLAWVVPLDWPAAAILAVTAPLIVVFMVLIGIGAESATRARWRTLRTLSAHFLDVVTGLETLRAHARDRAQVGTLAAAGDQYRRETMRTLRIAFLSALVLELIAMLGTALVAATVGLQLVDGKLGFAAGLTVLLLAPEVYAPLRQLGAGFHASSDGIAAAERLYAVIDTPPAVTTAEHPVPAPDPARAAVRLADVALTYPGRDRPALEGVTLELAPGETVGLVGPSGSGKSTLASLVLRLVDPGAGRITCDGVDLRDVDPRAWRALISWVPQRPVIFAGTVADNVRLGARAAPDAVVLGALEAARAAELVAGLPGGLQARIGEGGRALSAGEAQRIALARAFVRDTPLVVLDEPTAHLDEPTALATAEGVARLCAGRTALLIAHRPALAARADRIVVLEAGRLRESEAPAAAIGAGR